MPTCSRLAALLSVTMSLMLAPTLIADDAAPADEHPFTMIVMDPLCAELACDCVQGYAQRDYNKFGQFLAQYIGREVKVVFAASLVTALAGEAEGHCDLVIGKYSVVLYDANLRELDIDPVAQLTGKDGEVTQTGLFVVRSDDPAQTIEDIAGYRIFFGPEDCDEKSTVPMALMTEHGVALPETIETVGACSDGASLLIDLGPGAMAVAVISSYAGPLLEGCGTVKKGDLRVIAETEPIPFVSAFVPHDMDAELRAAVITGLMEVQYDLDMLVALETRSGFVEVAAELLEEADAVADAEKN